MLFSLPLGLAPAAPPAAAAAGLAAVDLDIGTPGPNGLGFVPKAPGGHTPAGMPGGHPPAGMPGGQPPAAKGLAIDPMPTPVPGISPGPAAASRCQS